MSMNSKKYADWINQNYPTKESCIGKAIEARERMQADFPELILTTGYVLDAQVWNSRRQHWWFKTLEGEMVDPTINIFENSFDYLEVDEFDPIRDTRTSKCRNCFISYFVSCENNHLLCGEKCYQELHSK
jgi:hypothetical protein